MKELELKVSETFYSIQGEGVTAGKPAYFLRLSDCNLLCGGKGTIKDKKLHDGATWRCDSIETWRFGQKLNQKQLIECFGEEFIFNLSSKSAHLVITGGEPLLQQEALVKFIGFIKACTKFRAYIEIETNGTIAPNQQMGELVDQWNVSYKLKNSGMPHKLRFKPQAIEKFNWLNAYYKFVITNEDDYAEYFEEWNPYISCTNEKVCLMPGTDTLETYGDVSKLVIELCKTKGYRFSPRIQIAVYNQKTGV